MAQETEMDAKVDERLLADYFSYQNDVKFALLFGSFAQECNSPVSDIDIAVYFGENKDKLRLGEKQIEITSAIMRLCSANRVDIVILNIANPFLRFQVIKYGRLLYAKDEKSFYRFKADSLGGYQDIKPLYDLYDKIAANSLKRGEND